MDTVLRILCFCFGFLGFLFLSCATGGRAWVCYSNNNIDSETGLWEACSMDTCNRIKENIPDYLYATRAMMLFSVLSILLSVVISLIKIIPKCCVGVKIIDLVQGIFYLVAAFCSFIGLIVYVAEEEFTDINGYEFGWSFILGWLGFILSIPPCLIAFYCFCTAKPTNQIHDNEKNQKH